MVILPFHQFIGIKNYIVGIIIKLSSDEATMEREKTLLRKLNMVLIQLLKQEWPHKWPTFISEIIQSSRSSISLCENNMIILRLLSEEIFEFGTEQLTQQKIRTLKTQIKGEFQSIFELCAEVLEKTQKPSLIAATLETLLRFLVWIPLGYVYTTNVVSLMIERVICKI